MEMCYDGALVMPCSYAVMSEDEMTYVEGGAYYEVKDTLGSLRDFFANVTIAAGIGLIASGIGTILKPIFFISDLFFGFLLSKFVECYSKIDKWIASDKYTKKTVGYMGMTTLGGFMTDISVSLTPN